MGEEKRRGGGGPTLQREKKRNESAEIKAETMLSLSPLLLLLKRERGPQGDHGMTLKVKLTISRHS